MTRLRARGLAAALPAVAALLAGCASPKLDAQWSDRQFAGQPPRGAKVLVVCRAVDTTLRRVCADRLAEQLLALGAVPLRDDGIDGIDGAADAPPGDLLLAVARRAGAAAMFVASVAPASAVATPGPTIGIGIGGLGGGSRGGVGVGFGVNAPVGGASVQTGYAASATLTDAASGKPMWSGTASAPPSSDVPAQLASLARLLLEGAKQSGHFSI